MSTVKFLTVKDKPDICSGQIFVIAWDKILRSEPFFHCSLDSNEGASKSINKVVKIKHKEIYN